MKKTNKLIPIILLTIMMLIIVLSNTVYAQVNLNNINNNKTDVGEPQLKSIGGIILGTITSFGIVLSVVILAIIGFKYMLASVEEKAEYKKSMMPYIIGCALVFSASTIATVVYKFFK